MRVIVLGASGEIGQEIVRALIARRHNIITAGLRTGDIRVDYSDERAVRAMFEAAESFDALVAVVGGDSVFKPYDQLTDEDFELGFRRKFLAQLNLVRLGVEFINDRGSFTLSSGCLSHYPNEASMATGPFNAAIDAYVAGAAPLLPRGIRVNVVSPAPIVPADRASMGLVSAEQAARSYVECVDGYFTGRIVRAWGGLEDMPMW